MRVVLLLALLGSLAACDAVFSLSYVDPLDGAAHDTAADACLRDRFDDGALDLQKWRLGDPANAPITVSERGGQLVLALAAGTAAPTENALVSAPHDVLGGQAVVEVIRPIPTSAVVSVLALVDADGAYTITASGGTIRFGTIHADASPPTEVPYDPIAMAHWRILYLDIPSPDPQPPVPTIHYDVSADGLSWVNQHSDRAVVSLAALEVQLGARAATVAVAEHVAFDNFQLATRSCPLQ